MYKCSLVPSPCAPPSEKPPGELSRNSWAYSLNVHVVRTNEIAKLLQCSTSLTAVKFCLSAQVSQNF